jgi:hypothetical protein
VTACGAQDSPAASAKHDPEPTVPVAAKPAIPPAPSSVVSDKPKRREPPLGCSDGGALAGAALAADGGGRYCIDSDCWRFDDHSITPIRDNPTNVLTLAAGEVKVEPERFQAAPPDPWTAGAVEDGKHDMKICEVKSATCSTLHLDTLPITSKYGGDDGVAAAGVSDSGERVEVVRGTEWSGPNQVEIYERATGKILARLRSGECLKVSGFAGETAIVQEWACVNQGGPRYLVSPDGKTTTKVDHTYGNGDTAVKLDDKTYALHDHYGVATIFDATTAKVRADVTSDQFAVFGAARGRLYAWSSMGALSEYDADGKQLASVKPESCRWSWEDVAIGGVTVHMSGQDVIKTLHMPRAQKRLGDGLVAWQYDDGLTLTMQNDGNSMSPKPRLDLLQIDVAAPSALRVMGVGIGTPVAELDRVLGPYEVARTDTSRTYGNAKDLPRGWVVTLDHGAVGAIRVNDDYNAR